MEGGRWREGGAFIMVTVHVTGCVDGRYGEKCDKECGACATPPCDVTTGTCPCPPEEDYTLNVTIKVYCERCLPGFIAPLCKRKTQTLDEGGGWVLVERRGGGGGDRIEMLTSSTLRQISKCKMTITMNDYEQFKLQ